MHPVFISFDVTELSKLTPFFSENQQVFIMLKGIVHPKKCYCHYLLTFILIQYAVLTKGELLMNLTPLFLMMFTSV